MSGHRLAAIAAALSLATGACSGYADLPLPLREQAALAVESIAVFPGATGRAQITIDLPDDVAGPVVLVGHPLSATPGLRVTAWAWGPCPDGPPPSDDSPRLCLAIEADAATPTPGALTLSLVAESRADARRFTVFGDGAVP